jgi:hypothetical protein
VYRYGAVLDRPRHEGIIAELRLAGARIKLIPDGDVVRPLFNEFSCDPKLESAWFGDSTHEPEM